MKNNVIKMSEFVKKKQQKEKDRIINELINSAKTITWLYSDGDKKNDN